MLMNLSCDITVRSYFVFVTISVLDPVLWRVFRTQILQIDTVLSKCTSKLWLWLKIRSNTIVTQYDNCECSFPVQFKKIILYSSGDPATVPAPRHRRGLRNRHASQIRYKTSWLIFEIWLSSRRKGSTKYQHGSGYRSVSRSASESALSKNAGSGSILTPEVGNW